MCYTLKDVAAELQIFRVALQTAHVKGKIKYERTNRYELSEIFRFKNTIRTIKKLTRRFT
jgi:hypothetical protein